MGREYRYGCPNMDCGYSNFDGGECPECGLELDKIKGENVSYMNSESDERGGEPVFDTFDDDPDAINWYGEESEYEAI